MTTLAARLFSQREGFGKIGALPTRNNNPGDLRHAPGASHEPGNPDGIAAFKTVAEGWAALDRQLSLYASRGMSVQQAVYVFAPPAENNSAAYLAFICAGLGCNPTTPMATAIKIGDSAWQTPSIKSPLPVGSLPAPSSAVPVSVSPPAKSLLQSVTGLFTRRSVPNSQVPSLPSALPQPHILSPIESKVSRQSTGAIEMSTPNPILKAAAPTLITAIQEFKAALNTILTGDPMQIPLRAGPAASILVAQLELLVPGLAVAEVGVVQTDVNSKLDGIVSKLQALNAT